MAIPKIFISYSHDSSEHKNWVLEFATRLRDNGIDVILDQFELKAGDDVPHFMETHLIASDKILMICTENYVEKANKGIGGVGYEKMIITSTLMKRIDENKIIPIIRQNSVIKVPTFLVSKLYIDFSKKIDYETNMEALIRNIYGLSTFQKKPIGENPFKLSDNKKLNKENELINHLIKAIVEESNNSDEPNVSTLAFRLKIRKVLVQVGIIKLIKLGYAEWYLKDVSVYLTDRGKLYAYENDLIE